METTQDGAQEELVEPGRGAPTIKELEELLDRGDYRAFKERSSKAGEGESPELATQLKAWRSTHLGVDPLAIGMVAVVAAVLCLLGVLWLGA